MKVVLERIEITWWHFHIRLLDESDLLQRILPYLRVVWLQRGEIKQALTWSLAGLPAGLVIALLKFFL